MSQDWFWEYSKALRYAASRSADLGDALFLIGSQNTWDTLFLAKSLEDTLFFDLRKKNIMPIHDIEYEVVQFMDTFVFYLLRLKSVCKEVQL